MTFDEYAEKAQSTAKYPLIGRNMLYPAAKLAGEAGELLDKIGKHWRNNYALTEWGPLETELAQHDAACWGFNPDSLTPEQRLEILKEVGDCLWYINAMAIELRSTLKEVGMINIDKLADRRARGVVCGEGDNR